MADSAEASAASEAPVQAEEDGFVVVQSASALPSTGIVTRTQFLSCLLEYSYQQMFSWYWANQQPGGVLVYYLHRCTEWGEEARLRLMKVTLGLINGWDERVPSRQKDILWKKKEIVQYLVRYLPFTEAPPHSNGAVVRGSGATPGQRPQDFSRMKVVIDCCRLDPSSYSHSGLKLLGSSKPNLYVEMSVDGKPSKKTEFSRASYQPKWSAEFSVVATPYSKVSFKRDCIFFVGREGFFESH